MIFLIKAGKNFWQKFRNVLWALFDDSDSSKYGFLSNVSAVIRNTFKDLIVKLSCKLSRTNFTDDTKYQSYDTVV